MAKHIEWIRCRSNKPGNSKPVSRLAAARPGTKAGRGTGAATISKSPLKAKPVVAIFTAPLCRVCHTF